ncbi:molecular chaperone SurA [Ideonella dechloratans]|uniref:Chaperone SurA n=1 Tax=Ideonella dechloratans TaxID=36863 RepID=A0A643F980_IDEDE|nr:peptidylprolyl isomerase [Ideonella dechloratans]KAB0578178.1 molecular chaperone SurA [Ideonella dechloratans]UFU09853.1 peptidylprolyl isomerase [Ideonella dechloratans]
MIASSRPVFRVLTLTAALVLPHAAALAQAVAAQPAKAASAPATADYIVAVVNNELVTEVEVQQRMAQLAGEAQRNQTAVPDAKTLRQQAIDGLINERLQITAARDSGMTVDDAELQRAVENVASMNRLTVAQLREQLKHDGMDFFTFRSNLRDQILAQRIRDREVQSRIKVSDAEIEDYLAAQRASQAKQVELNIAQILVAVPEGASDDVVAQKRARIEQAQARLKAGEPFALVAKDMSEDANRERGGEIGGRPMDRLPDLFVNAVRFLPVGGVTPQPLRSGAGFHLLKLLSRAESNPGEVVQTRARHILLRPSAQLSVDEARLRLSEFRSQILAGKARFEDLARQYSEDGTASRGGDLGWTGPGAFVPEFETAMNALSKGGISQPVVSRYGVHLIQVLDRREVKVSPEQLRDQAKAVLSERKYPQAYNDWLEELRSHAFIEMREPPL